MPNAKQQELLKDVVMKKSVLRARIRKKMAEFGFHNAGNQRFVPVNKEKLNKDLDDFEIVCNELVRSQMQKVLEEFFKQ